MLKRNQHALDMKYKIAGPKRIMGAPCEKVLRALPQWFGIEEAIVEYASAIEKLDTFLAIMNDEVIGFMSVKQHFDHAAELYVLGVLPQYHRQGIGRALFEKTESHCRSMGIQFLQVKTLSPNRESEAYQRTRQRYMDWGFTPLEEFPDMWGKEIPCLMMVKAIRPESP